MASAVGLAALLSRALVQHLPERGAQYAEDVMKLDLARSRNAFTNLIDYHASIGDTGKSAKIKAYRQNAYPEVIALKQVSAMFTSGQLAQGKQVLDAVIERTPDYAEAWAGLCIYHYRTRQYDSALHAARIADGLNPNNPAVLFNMGLAEYSLGNPVTAEKLWLKSVRIDSSFAALSLAHLYRDRKDTAQYSIFLFAAASRSTARPDDLKEAIQLAISRNQLDRASQFILRYRALGVDSGWVDSVSVLYPTLK
jgi:tetratricopeptide (TPR) repeat protein